MKFLLIIFFALLQPTYSLACVCPTGQIAVQLDNPNLFIVTQDKCGKPPPGLNTSPKRCWRWDAWSQRCRWFAANDPGGYSKEYFKHCPGVIQLEYQPNHSCILPPKETTCICINPAIHINGCQFGEIRIISNQGEKICTAVIPPTTLTFSKNHSTKPINCSARNPNYCLCPTHT